MPVFITALIRIPPRRTAVTGCAAPRLPQSVNLTNRRPPRSSAPRTGTFRTRTTARSSTSVSRIKPPLTFAPTTTSTATRRRRASDGRAAQTAWPSSANTRFCLSTSFIPRIPTFMASAFVVSQL